MVVIEKYIISFVMWEAYFKVGKIFLIVCLPHYSLLYLIISQIYDRYGIMFTEYKDADLKH